MSYPPLEVLIPHRGTAVLIDGIADFGEGRILCAARAFEGHPYVSADGQVPTVVGLELMAQAVAAYVGMAQHEKGEPPRAGFIVGVRRLTLNAEVLPRGATLSVGARLAWGEARAATFDCWVDAAEARLCETTLTVYQPDRA